MKKSHISGTFHTILVTLHTYQMFISQILQTHLQFTHVKCLFMNLTGIRWSHLKLTIHFSFIDISHKYLVFYSHCNGYLWIWLKYEWNKYVFMLIHSFLWLIYEFYWKRRIYWMLINYFNFIDKYFHSYLILICEFDWKYEWNNFILVPIISLNFNAYLRSWHK